MSAAVWSASFCCSGRLPMAPVTASPSFSPPPCRAVRSMFTATKPAVAARRTTSRMCSVWPRFSWMTMTPGTRPLTFGLATYAMSETPSVPLISGLDTPMRGSFSRTVMPSVVAAGGGVANGLRHQPLRRRGRRGGRRWGRGRGRPRTQIAGREERHRGRGTSHDDRYSADELAPDDEPVAEVFDVLLDEITLRVVQSVHRILPELRHLYARGRP